MVEEIQNLDLNSEWSQRVLNDLGLLMALDVFINNWDRIPIIWENKGNPGNILFVPANIQRPVVGIDQYINAILKNQGSPDADNYVVYLERGGYLLKFLIESKSNESLILPNCCTIVDYFNENNPSIMLDTKSLSIILKGINQGIISICQNITDKVIDDLWVELSREATEYISMKGKGNTELYYGLEFVNTKFLKDVKRLFNNFYKDLIA